MLLLDQSGTLKVTFVKLRSVLMRGLAYAGSAYEFVIIYICRGSAEVLSQTINLALHFCVFFLVEAKGPITLLSCLVYFFCFQP